MFIANKSLIVSGLTIAMVNNSSIKVEVNGALEPIFGKVRKVDVRTGTFVVEYFEGVEVYNLSDITDIIS